MWNYMQLVHSILQIVRIWCRLDLKKHFDIEIVQNILTGMQYIAIICDFNQSITKIIIDLSNFRKIPSNSLWISWIPEKEILNKISQNSRNPEGIPFRNSPNAWLNSKIITKSVEKHLKITYKAVEQKKVIKLKKS